MSTFKTHINNMIKFLRSGWLVWPVIIMTLLVYSYRIMNPTLSEDDLGVDFYFNQGGMLSQGRWSQVILFNLLKFTSMNASITMIYSIVFLVISIFPITSLIKKASNDMLHPLSYIVFSLFYISYPLIVEIAMYDGGFFFVCLGYLIVPIGIMAMQAWIEEENLIFLFLSATILATAIALYESFASVYIVIALMLLLLDYQYNSKINILRSLDFMKTLGLTILPLLIGILINGIIYWLVNNLLVLPPSHSSNQITWSLSFINEGKLLIFQFINDYIFNAFAYLPLMVLLIAILVQISLAVNSYIKKRQSALVILPLLSTMSLFAISVISGRIQTYRMDTNFALYIAFTALMITQIVVMHKSLFLKVFALLFLGIGLVWQVNDINKWFFVEELRYQQDLAIVREIGTRLEREFDVQKPVVFVGNNEFDDTIKEFLYVPNNSLAGYLHNEVAGLDRIDWEYSYQITQTAIHTYFNWANTAYYTREYVSQTYAFFHYFGYDNLIRDNRENQGEIAEKLGDPSFWVTDDYIMETDRFVIVNFDRY